MSENEETTDKPISEDWILVYDENSKRDYYFNINTEESHWDVPEGLEGYSFERYDSLEGDGGWYYLDFNGQQQGPFEKELLLSWRPHFPMNTLMWSQSTDMDSKDKARPFAEIIGDEELLERWKNETLDHENKVAPSASDYEYYLDNPIEPPEETEYTTEMSYADAVLAGLPAEDDTIRLAQLSKQSGTPLKDIVRFVRTSTADVETEQMVVKDPYSGKMTAVPAEAGEKNQLYSEFEAWIDPTKMEEGLQRSAKYRREKLPSLWMKQVGYKKRTLPWQDERYDRGDYD